MEHEHDPDEPDEPPRDILGEAALQVAEWFHEAYERLAPTFGYTTRPDSAVPWESVPDANRRLMVAVAKEVLDRLNPVPEQTR